MPAASPPCLTEQGNTIPPDLRVLVLGGTTEASTLCRMLATGWPACHAVLSLAGATRQPHLPTLATRIGSFGGVQGLTDWLHHNAIDAVVDATHPFAAQMSRHAALACTAACVPLLRLERPGWKATPHDEWLMVPNISDAASTLAHASRWNTHPQSVFLTTGRKETRPFGEAPQHHYLFRSIEQPEAADLPPHTCVIRARGPFDLAAELQLMREHNITVLVTKNSGGAATYPKLEAARMLGIPVIMIARPARQDTPHAEDATAALAWLHQRASSTLRDV
ncbi:cobalt-precorrin-6A reductase [Acetobacter lambici]|uniref:Cobalt-precorrin-6A reductase n=1 Tax=Acetobacter lambici TaxID=1332824 RepID=A0ABT1F0Y0_9PROT|nr:cobalt-precorrin-6A reductase [Acetobacter lambici]MCP1242650.1 cobalt-precorrin-6A reductase [Acetobacter lambici]MCP1258861.1 cobalt-precorrin-6A reductase [Acetobacter lambici]NHO57169.1 cobalt-precorrin-6A reductase [Acetobacter lambici]